MKRWYQKRWTFGVLAPMALLFVWLVLRVTVLPPKAPALPPESPSTASVAPEPPPIPSETAAPPEPSEAPPPEKLLYEYTTRFKAGPRFLNRGHNIKLLSDKLQNLTLEPGEEFSFNKRAGPRTLKEGYKSAPTYFLGEVIPGIGGGSCQVSSTLYAAVLHANVEVTDRRPHSRKSNYIHPGLDATVNYPKECWGAKKPDKRICFDLQFRNPYDFPITILFKIGDIVEDKKGEKTRPFTVSVYGSGEIPKVTTVWKPHGAPPFKVRYRRVSWWKDDRKKLKQSGRPGLRGTRVLTIEHPDGRKETKRVYSKYQPVPEVWRVGLEFEKPEEPEEPSEPPKEEEATP